MCCSCFTIGVVSLNICLVRLSKGIHGFVKFPIYNAYASLDLKNIIGDIYGAGFKEFMVPS